MSNENFINTTNSTFDLSSHGQPQNVGMWGEHNTYIGDPPNPYIGDLPNTIPGRTYIPSPYPQTFPQVSPLPALSPLLYQRLTEEDVERIAQAVVKAQQDADTALAKFNAERNAQHQADLQQLQDDIHQRTQEWCKVQEEAQLLHIALTEQKELNDALLRRIAELEETVEKVTNHRERYKAKWEVRGQLIADMNIKLGERKRTIQLLETENARLKEENLLLWKQSTGSKLRQAVMSLVASGDVSHIVIDPRD